VSKAETMKQFFCSWLCGISPSSDNAVGPPDADEVALACQREEKVCSLEQDPVAKIVLHCLLAVIILIGVGLFFFFSLWRYEVS
jgi:hypothetical protein